MYAGGAPYYGLIERLGQPASFFNLYNEDYQLLAGDTGFRDFNPLSMGGGAVGMQDYDGKEPTYSEVTWHRRQLDVAKAVGRKTIFMTHHQPFTFNAVIDGRHGINSKLLRQLSPYAGDVALWLWGHEHNQVIYEPFKGFERGRCIGASAIPVWEDDALYTLNEKIVGEYAPAKLGFDIQLGIEEKSRRYRLGYGLINIDGKTANETYYELDTETGVERELFTGKI